MNENNCKLLQSSPPSTSEAAGLNLSNKPEDIDMEEEDNEDDSTNDTSLWSIDDTFFYGQGLMNHSAGKGKSVFVTWNENYLLNFVFKTSSKTRKTSLTKVHLTMPDQEEIEDMLILEMNTLLHMKSGCVYYFSSVKSMHKVEWLTGVRCMTSCPHGQFSVIRLISDVEAMEKRLLLEVYQDVPQLGKYPNGQEVLRHSYDISFDLKNIFNCDWLDELYTLVSLITSVENMNFVRQLVAMGNIFRTVKEKIEVVENQEVHIFTVSGNVFILLGAIICNSDSLPANQEIDHYSIQSLNTYASNVECIRLDVKKKLLIVLLQSGHMDIWYTSNKIFGALLHHQQHISYYLHYDYIPTNNTFYFVTPEEVIQFKIVISYENPEEECMVQETHKAISGMVACTWVESLQQLICLSFNNIFYRLCFVSRDHNVENLKQSETYFENYNKLYALTTKRVKDLIGRAQVINELMAQPEHLHQAIEEEFQKQQLLAMGTKHEILQKMYQSYIEYHINLPGMEYFPKEITIVKARFNKSTTSFKHNSVYCLIFLSGRKNNDSFLSVLTKPMWHLLISDQHNNSLLLHIPSDLLNKKLCVIVKCSLEQTNKMLPNLSLNMLTFLNHCSSYISLNFSMNLIENEKTYHHIFTHNIQNVPFFRNSECDIEHLLKEFNNRENNDMDYVEEFLNLKYCLKITKNELLNIFKKLHIHDKNVVNTEFKLFFLHQYLLELKYDESKEILAIFSHYPEALFYIKLLLIYESKSRNDVEINLIDVKTIQQRILQYQCEIERLYGSLTSSDCLEEDSNTISIHFENMLKVYFKLRTEIIR